MRDQADELRELAQHAGAGWRAPWTLAVTAGKGGVGTTTIAVNLAVSLAREGRGVLLVDADLSGGDATRLCGLEALEGLEDVLSNRRSVADVVLPGPGGISVLPAAWATGRLADCPPSAQTRLLRQIEQLAPFDAVVFDLGVASSHSARRFWQAADLVCVVSSTEAAAILDSYAVIKAMTGPDGGPRVATLLNRAGSAASAAEAQARLAQACYRFLGLTISSIGWAPHDPQAAFANEQGLPVVAAAPQGGFARAVREVSRILTAEFNSTQGNADRRMDRQHGLCC